MVHSYKVGLLAVINGVITLVNVQKNKWVSLGWNNLLGSYNSMYNWWRGPPCNLFFSGPYVNRFGPILRPATWILAGSSMLGNSGPKIFGPKWWWNMVMNPMVQSVNHHLKNNSKWIWRCLESPAIEGFGSNVSGQWPFLFVCVPEPKFKPTFFWGNSS